MNKHDLEKELTKNGIRVTNGMVKKSDIRMALAKIAQASPLSNHLNQLIKKDWEMPIEKKFAGEIEDRIAAKNLPEHEARREVLKLYRKYLPDLSSATDDFWDLISEILHGVKASAGCRIKE